MAVAPKTPTSPNRSRQHFVLLYMLLAALLVYSHHPAPHAYTLAALLATIACGLVLPLALPPPLPLLLRAMKRDARILAHMLFDLPGLAREIEALQQDDLRRGLPWMNAATKEDVVLFKSVLADAARTLRGNWGMMLLLLEVGLCLGVAVPVLVRWLVGGGRDEGAAAATTTMTVGELEPLGTCLGDVAGWTSEVLRLERRAAEGNVQ